MEGSKPLSDIPLGKLRVSEDEQDLDWALEHGIVSPGEYKDLLDKIVVLAVFNTAAELVYDG